MTTPDFFDPRIQLTQVMFIRNNEGRLEIKTSPVVLDFGDIVRHGDGWVFPAEENEPINVEEDAQMISSMITNKLSERAEFEARMRKHSALGMDEIPGED
jgi:hypothetical protein